MVYIINPFNHATALADICTAFWQLFQMYVTDIGGEQERQLDEVVLQVIPMGFLLSSESIVVPSQAEYLSLALEVYSRCPPRDPVSNLVYSAAPMVLAESPSKTINFKLTSEKQSPLLDEKSLHIAWSTSPDQRWITVAWSDSAGSLQQTISYCLRFRDSNASRDKAQVRTEVWSATEGIMDKVQARWRVIIVGTESLDEYEIDSK